MLNFLKSFRVIVVVGAIWTVDIGLGSGRVMSRVAVVPSSIHGLAICFQ